jgi:hypothetical protein
MKYHHHQLEFEIDDSWLAEANVTDFVPSQESYVADQGRFPGSEILIVLIEDVSPLTERARIKGVFCDSEDTGDTAKERVMRILHWFRENEPVEPVKVVRLENSAFKFKLVEGSHRFHCALAMGFVSVPAVIGFEFEV